MPIQNYLVRRSNIQIYVPYLGVADALSDENSWVVKTVQKFKYWFEDTDVEIRYCPHVEGGFRAVYIVCSYCTTERLKAYVLDAISFARQLARELGQDRIIMVINNSRFDVNPI